MRLKVLAKFTQSYVACRTGLLGAQLKDLASPIFYLTPLDGDRPLQLK